MSIKSFLIRHHRIFGPLLIIRKFLVTDKKLYNYVKKQLKSERNGRKRIYYLGVPTHTNLGDLAQGVCIRKWLKKHYPDYQVIEIETNSLVNTCHSALDLLKTDYRKGDFIVYQSGYTTTDLGGYADEMHRAVMNVMPEARMLMLPQTIFFKSKVNEIRTSKCYNSLKHMLFLARDEVSYRKAEEMFPDIKVELYPDIVTSLIGTKHYSQKRNGILMCCRDDLEKFYTDKEILNLMERLKGIGKVSMTDTTKRVDRLEIVRNAEKYIWKEIEEYSKYRCVITDRYHGTIFSLVASTPVIIIKSTDHKVTTGINWFEDVYEGYVYRAENLEQAYELAKKIYDRDIPEITNSYFEEKYYDRLPYLFSKTIGDE